MPGRWQRLVAVGLLVLVGIATVAASGNDSSTGSGSGDAGGSQEAAAAPDSTEQDLLKWALSHSDPDALRGAATEARRGVDAGSAEFLERQQAMQELLQAMKQEPTEADLMREAVAIVSNSSASQQRVADALEALRYLVEPIDNANDLQGMGGLAPVVALLGRQHSAQLQAAAAYVLGTAASNNQHFQQQLLVDHPDVLLLLLQLLGPGGSSTSPNSSSGGEQQAAAADTAAAEIKALYCLSAILRLSSTARATFYQAAGVPTLQQVLRGSQASLGLKRKALGLLTDLIRLDAAAMAPDAAAAAQAAQHADQQHGAVAAAGLDYPATVATALLLLDVEQQPLEQQDPDLQEKSLLALLAMLDSSSTHAGNTSDGRSRPAAAGLIADLGGLAILRRLEAGLETAAAAEGGEEGAYLLVVLDLVRQVQRQVQLLQPGGSAGYENTHDAGEL